MTLSSVLVVHNYYQQPGGEDHVFQAECALLESRGHRVIRHSVRNDELTGMTSARLARITLWNRDAYHELRRLILREQPDCAHFHNTFPLLSPAVYHAAKAEGVPVVQTLHNYRLLCPAATLFRDGHPCEDCLGRAVAWPAVQHRCYRGSRTASAGVAAMLAVHTACRTWRSSIDLYLALTPFVRAKFIEAGLPGDRIVVKPNFVDPDPGMGPELGAGALYVGRLAEEKGLATLLEAWRQVDPAIPLRIIGNGPLLGTVTEAARAQPNVEVLGWRPYDEVLAAMKSARVLIMPSVWYETFGLVVIQAMAVGLPVVVSGFGAMADLIDHRRTGLHFRPGDPADLAAQVRWLLDHPREAESLRAAARAEYEAKYTADRNYEALLRAYAEAGARSRGTLSAATTGSAPAHP